MNENVYYESSPAFFEINFNKRRQKCQKRGFMSYIIYGLMNFQHNFLLLFKGHLILKGNFSVFNSPKNELENVNFCPSLLGQKFFVRFLGELKKTKSPFETNWPLGAHGFRPFSLKSVMSYTIIHGGTIIWNTSLYIILCIYLSW